MHMKFAAVGLTLSCAVLAAADKSIESGFLDALGIAKSKVIEKVMPETQGAKLYREGMLLRYSQPLNSDKAFVIFKQGFEAGNAGCAYELALCYLSGIGTRMSQSNAISTLESGMKLSDGSTIDCELQLIKLHTGEPLSLYEEPLARKYVRRLVQLAQGNARAAAMLTKIRFKDGQPPTEFVTAEEHLNAVGYLKSRSSAGDPLASFEYGKILLGFEAIENKENPKYTPVNFEEGLRLLKFAATKNVHGSHYALWKYYSAREEKPLDAFNWARTGWASGDCKSGRVYSSALISGHGTSIDKALGVQVALQVAEHGDAYDTFTVADSYDGRFGFDRSLQGFLTWHKRAAEKGNWASADQLGIYYAGEEVKQFEVTGQVNLEEAFKYFQIGAYPDGPYNHVFRFNSLLYLGDMYRRGIGCPQDLNKAAEVYLDYLRAFKKIDYSGKTEHKNGAKVRMLWLKKHYPNLPGVGDLDDSRLKFNGVVDYMYSFRHFAKEDFDYELFDEIAALVKMRGPDEKKEFQKACDFVERTYGIKDGLFYFADLEYGKDFNSYSYEWYKEAALSGSASAAYRLHDMLMTQSSRPGTINAGPEYALRLSIGRTTRELVIAHGESEAWRLFAISLEDSFNFGRTKKRDFQKVADGPPFFSMPGDQVVLPVLQKINEAHRAQMLKNSSHK